MRNLIRKIFNRNKKQTKQHDFEWERFQKVAKEQLVRLKNKGLTIPIATL